MQTGAQLPKSVSRWKDPFILCAVIVLSYWAFSRLPISNTTLSLYIIGVSIAVMGTLERMRSSLHRASHSISATFPHAAISWLGTLVGLLAVLIAWESLATYRDSYYAPFFHVLPLFLISAVVVSGIYHMVIGPMFGHSIRGDYQLGLALLGRKEVQWARVRDALLVWLLRGFFLPINFCELVDTINVFRGHGFLFLQGPWTSVEYYVLLIIYVIIIAAVVPGYIFGARLIGTETKEVSHSWFAWTVTLACYAPFETAFFKSWFNYNPSVANPVWFEPWVSHFQTTPVVLQTIGGLLVILSLVHLWGEAQFGLRSSNISNRGIITTGPYRFFKHPVYAAKCLVWLLIWLPFMSGISVVDDIRLTLLWACVCGIYALRALAEEKLLSDDPAYVAYALWMDEHGAAKDLGAMFPPLRFSWRLAYWQKVR